MLMDQQKPKIKPVMSQVVYNDAKSRDLEHKKKKIVEVMHTSKS